MSPETRLRQPRHSLGRKIILASLGVLVISLGLMSGTFSVFYSQETRQEFERDLDNARKTCLKVVELQSSRLKAALDSIRFSPRFRSAIEVGVKDMATLADSAQTEFRLLRDAELMAVADGWGDPLLVLEGDGSSPLKLTTEEIKNLKNHASLGVFATDEGWDQFGGLVSDRQIFEDYFMFRGHLYRVLSAPIYDNFENLIAILVIGDMVNEELVQELARISGCDVTFADTHQYFATSLPEGMKDTLGKAGKAGANKNIWEAGPWLLMREELKVGSQSTDVQILLKRSLDGFYQNRERMLTGSLGLLVLLGLLSFGLNLATTRSVTKPIKSLAGAIEKVGRGDLAVEVQIHSKDEVQLLGDAFNEMVVGLRERQNMSRYLTGMEMKEVQEASLKNAEVIQGGSKQIVSILFSDIRSFTTLCERADPDLVVRSLNYYYSELIPIIEEHNGSLDKLIGDCIMAVFHDSEDRSSADHALDAAIAMRDRLIQIRPGMLRNGLLEFYCGFGINTGEVVLGNVGTREQFSKTVLGDSVNLAARVESLSKEGKETHILLTEETLNSMKKPKPTSFLCEVTVKGKSKPVRIHEVCAVAVVTAS